MPPSDTRLHRLACPTGSAVLSANWRRCVGAARTLLHLARAKAGESATIWRGLPRTAMLRDWYRRPSWRARQDVAQCTAGSLFTKSRAARHCAGVLGLATRNRRAMKVAIVKERRTARAPGGGLARHRQANGRHGPRGRGRSRRRRRARSFTDAPMRRPARRSCPTRRRRWPMPTSCSRCSGR